MLIRKLFPLSLVTALVPHLRAQSATTTLVDATSGGAAPSVGATGPAISGDGLVVGFVSGSAGLVAGDANSALDVFVRERVSGAITRVSVATGGAESHPVVATPFYEPFVSLPSLSADGRWVAFASSAPDLVAGDANGRVDVFLRDRVTGTTELVSSGLGGAAADGHSGVIPLASAGFGGTYTNAYPAGVAVSSDGRYVAFASLAQNLVAGDANGAMDVFVRDRVAGTTELVSVSSSGAQGDGLSAEPTISADGRFVAFESFASNLVAGDTNSVTDVFVRDRQLGTTTRVSVATSGVQGDQPSGLYSYHQPFCADCGIVYRLPGSSISADGRYVVFGSLATTLAPATTGGISNVFVRDLAAHTTTILTPSANGASQRPAISADGRFVAFASAASNLGAADASSFSDVYRVDRALGTVTIEDVDSLGSQGQGECSDVAISADGASLALSTAAQLAPSDSNFLADVYVRGAPTHAFDEACDGSQAGCPCANAGAPGHGCASSASTLGARLAASGDPRVASDTIVLAASGLPDSTPTLFVQAASSHVAGAAPVFGDGVLCLSGALTRLATRNASFGAAALGVAADPRVSQLGAVPASGGVRHYSAVYRNAASFCTASTWNTTNSIGIAWQP